MTRWKDFDISFDRQTDGDVKESLDIEAIKNSIKNIFLTKQGSRRMLPDFAYGPYNLLFEPIDETTAQKIGEIFLSEIEKWDDRIIINNLHVDAKPDQNLYKIRINLSLGKVQDSEYIIEEILIAQ